LNGLGMNNVMMPPKLYSQSEKHHGDIRIMRAYLPGTDAAAVTMVNIHSEALAPCLWAYEANALHMREKKKNKKRISI